MPVALVIPAGAVGAGCEPALMLPLMERDAAEGPPVVLLSLRLEGWVEIEGTTRSGLS